MQFVQTWHVQSLFGQTGPLSTSHAHTLFEQTRPLSTSHTGCANIKESVTENGFHRK